MGQFGASLLIYPLVDRVTFVNIGDLGYVIQVYSLGKVASTQAVDDLSENTRTRAYAAGGKLTLRTKQVRV